MPGSWNPATYRERARKWREEAGTLPPGKDRDACFVLANGYANLAAIIDQSPDIQEAAATIDVSQFVRSSWIQPEPGRKLRNAMTSFALDAPSQGGPTKK
jgi:hypothetical protein